MSKAIESSAIEVRDAYSEVVSLIDEFLMIERDLEAGSTRRDRLEKIALKIDESTDNVVELARGQLDTLYTPPKVPMFHSRN